METPELATLRAGRLRISGPEAMRLRALVNAEIAPARIVDVLRLESIDAWAFLGRWGAFRFDVRLSGDMVRADLTVAGVSQLAHRVTALANEAVENAIHGIVRDQHARLADRDHRRIQELEPRLAELEALVQALVDRALNRWYVRLWRTVARCYHRVRSSALRRP